MENFNKTIQMLIFGGNPNGLIMCELSNWNGRAYKIARNDLSKFSERFDAEYTGVYILFGKDDANNEIAYIGEAERMLTRLKQHLNDEYYWNDFIAIVSKDNALNKAHVKYMENQFYTVAISASRTIVTNTTVPTRSSVSEYDAAMLEEFIDNAKLLISTLGYKIFNAIDNDDADRSTTDPDKDLFFISAARGANAKGKIAPDGFIVFAGSAIADSAVPSLSQNITALRSKLINDGTIDASFVFTKNYVFTSPSLAASVVLGRSANGRIEWKTSDKRTIKSIEEGR